MDYNRLPLYLYFRLSASYPVTSKGTEYSFISSIAKTPPSSPRLQDPRYFSVLPRSLIPPMAVEPVFKPLKAGWLMSTTSSSGSSHHNESKTPSPNTLQLLKHTTPHHNPPLNPHNPNLHPPLTNYPSPPLCTTPNTPPTPLHRSRNLKSTRPPHHTQTHM